FVLFVLFVFFVIVVVGVSRWGRLRCDGEKLVDASCPLVLQPSVKLYRIDRHLAAPSSAGFERRTRSAPSHSARRSGCALQINVQWETLFRAGSPISAAPIPLNDGWRTIPSFVTSRYVIFASKRGSTQVVSRFFTSTVSG